jgi:hypothetical protein
LASLGVGIAGLVLYNWWVFVAFDPHVMHTVNQLFSDLEATGQPHARLLSDLDFAAGTLIVFALLLARPDRAARWPRDLLIIFGVAAAAGGLFPYSCAEGINHACRDAEWSLALPWQQYVHIATGIVEFASASVAIFLLRTHPGRVQAQVARGVLRVLIVAYPLLAVAYVTDLFGAFIEPVFFISFSIAVTLVLVDDGGPRSPQTAVKDGRTSSRMRR